MTRPGLVIGAAIMVAAAVGTAAWLMLTPQMASLAQSPAPAPTAASPTTIAVPESTSPPEVSSADFGPPKTPPLTTSASTVKDKETSSAVDWPALPIDEVRERANADDVTAMEE